MSRTPVPDLAAVTPGTAMSHGVRSGIMAGLLVGGVGGTTYVPLMGSLLGAVVGAVIGAALGALGAPIVVKAARSGEEKGAVRHGRTALLALTAALLLVVAIVTAASIGGSYLFWTMFALYGTLLLLLSVWFVPHVFGSIADPDRKPTFTGQRSLRLPVLIIGVLSLVPGIVLWTLVLLGR